MQNPDYSKKGCKNHAYSFFFRILKKALLFCYILSKFLLTLLKKTITQHRKFGAFVKKNLFFYILLLFLISCDNNSSNLELPTAIPVAQVTEKQEPVILDYPILQDSAFFANKLGSTNLKIIFRDDNENFLVLVKINGSAVYIDTLKLDFEPHAPQFSPDGSKLAYASETEGAANFSNLYVMDLETGATQQLNVQSAGVPRWRVLENGDTAILYIDYLGNNKSPLWESSKTYIVPFVNDSFGNPQELFARSYNGGLALDNSFIVTGSNKLLLHYSEWENDKYIDLYNDQQVCNVSIARDSSYIFSFLETSGDKGKDYIGQKFWWHRYLFYMNKFGDIVKAIKAPGDYVFNYTEWINISNFQVSSIINNYTFENKLAIIDYLNSEVYPILEGKKETQIWEPDIWVER